MKKTLKIIFIMMLVSCGRSPYNSSTSDALKYGSTVTGSANFISARTVMLNNCFSCHGSWSAWNEAQFISNGRIVAASLDNSLLYTRIRGNTTSFAGDMPVSANLTSEDIVTIKTWILGI